MYDSKTADTSHEKDTKIKVTSKNVINMYLPFIKETIDRGYGVSLSDIRDMINEKEDVVIVNKVIKSTLIDHFGDKIQFCESDRKNQSMFVFSSSIKTSDILNTLRSIDTIKSAADILWQALKNVDFCLKDKFCDAEKLKNSWCNTKIPNELLSFFSILFNVKKTTLIKSYHDTDDALG